MKKLTLVVGIILASVISAVCAENNTPEFLYQKGLYLETAKADYEGAVKVYEKIIKKHEKNAEFVAKSLYRAGICYEKLGKSDKAGKAFNRLGNDYSKYLDSIEGASQKISASTQNPIVEKLNKKVSLRFVNAPIESVLSYLSSACGVNILIDAQALRSIDTRVSISLKDISVRQALEAVVRMRGLSYQVKEEYIWVSTPDKIQQRKEFAKAGNIFNAVENGNIVDIERLLEANPGLITEKDDNGMMPLHLATKEGNKKLVELLLAKGANVNAKNNDKSTPLHYAAGLNNKEIVELLLGKNANVNARDFLGRVPLHLSACRGNNEIIELLLDRGSAVKAENNEGFTSLYAAAQNGHRETVKLLISKGADVNKGGKAGWVPLHQAAHEGYKEIVQLLLDKGANVNAKTNDGWTPLHPAAQEGHTEIVELLLAKGANVNAVHDSGRTPLHQTVQYGYRDIAEILLDKGANINAKDCERLTPLSIAKKKGYTEITKLLLSRGAKR